MELEDAGFFHDSVPLLVTRGHKATTHIVSPLKRLEIPDTL
jgi:hypothetical protein